MILSLLILLAPTQEKSADFTVQAVDSRSGAAVEGVLFRLIEHFPPKNVPEPRVEEKKTGANGSVVFAALRPGTFQLVVADAPPAYAIEQLPATEVAKDLQRTVRLGPAARISGRVKVSDPARLSLVAVQAAQINGDSRIILNRQAEADGRFEFERLNRDLPLVITARSPGAHDHQLIVNLGRDEAERKGADVTLSPYDPDRISIRIRAERAGQPLARAPITVNGTEPVNGVRLAHLGFTAADGSYAVPDLPPGSYLVRLLVPTGDKTLPPPSRTVVVPADGAVDADFSVP